MFTPVICCGMASGQLILRKFYMWLMTYKCPFCMHADNFHCIAYTFSPLSSENPQNSVTPFLYVYVSLLESRNSQNVSTYAWTVANHLADGSDR